MVFGSFTQLPTFLYSISNMASEAALRGACSCGRNQYLIAIPSDSRTAAQVLFDDRAELRKYSHHKS